MKWKTIIFILLASATIGWGQKFSNVLDYVNQPEPLQKTFMLQSAQSSKIWVQLPGKRNGAQIDTLATGGSLPASDWQSDRGALWNGYMIIDLNITNNDLVTDSLSVKVTALDEDGNSIANDYSYATFGTAPGHSTGASYLSWTTATTYRADFTGAFGIGTFGFLIEVSANDAVSGHESTAGGSVIKVTLR